jgi:hypothetical protein
MSGLNQAPPRRNPTPQSPASEEVAQVSLAQQIADLAVGKSVAIADRLDGDEATKEVIRETRLRQRNTVAAAVSRAKARSGGTFTVEGGEITTRSLDILITLVVTRTA